MRQKLLEESTFQKNSLQAANLYLQKISIKKNTVNVPLVITVFGLVFFIAFLLFVR